jgi:hypothetical protein
MSESITGGAAAAPLSMRAAASLTSAAVRATRQLLTDIERRRRIDANLLRRALEAALAPKASDAWNWRFAYDVCEAATVLLLRNLSQPLRAEAGASAALLPMVAGIASCLPISALCSGDSQTSQPSSSPTSRVPAVCCAGPTPSADQLLQPFATTGSAAILLSRDGELGPVPLNPSWRLGIFVPRHASGLGPLSSGRDRYSVVCVVEREAE